MGLTWLKRLALGAPIGLLLFYISSLANSDFGDLRPTKPVDAVTTLGRIFRLALRITVSGPGQNSSVSFLKSSSYFSLCGSTKLLAASKSRTCTMIGSLKGLLLTL